MAETHQLGLLLTCALYLASRSLRGRRRRSEICENRVQFFSRSQPNSGPIRQEREEKWAGFSQIAADVPSAAQAPRSLRGRRPPSDFWMSLAV